jgi:predicted amidohydrolase
MRFAAIQFDIVWEDKVANHAIIERLLDDANVPAGTFVVLPEMGDTGFSFNLDRIVDERSIEWGMGVARDRGIHIQLGHVTRGRDHRGRNCATVINSRGEGAGQYQKVHPFSYGREIEHFSGGDHLLLVDAGHCSICPLICYDLRFPELWRVAARKGAQVFTIGASWPAARQRHWRSLLIARAIENQAFVIAVNRTGRDPHLEYEGGSAIIGPTGEILAEAQREAAVLQAEIDIESLLSWRSTFPALHDLQPSLLGDWPVLQTKLLK